MQIDDTALKTLAAKAVLDSLTQENRDELMRSAIASLFEPVEGGRYGSTDKRTKLQSAFDSALRFAVDNIIGDMLREPQNSAKIREAITVAIEEMLTKKADDGGPPLLTKFLCDAFERGLQRKDY